MNVEMKKPCMTMIVSHHQENSSFLDTRGYECKTCGKRFSSYQALGGHQGIHKKVRPINDSYDECELRLDISDPSKYLGLHRCKQCMKEFETGQALGGHMRRHRVEKDLVLMQEEILRRQKQGSDEEGKSDLMMGTEEVSRLKAEDYRRREMMRSELILAAREWRLSI